MLTTYPVQPHGIILAASSADQGLSFSSVATRKRKVDGRSRSPISVSATAMSSAMRFVACSVAKDRELLLLLNRQAESVASITCSLCRTDLRSKQKPSLSSTYPVSVFVLDCSPSSSFRSSGKCRAVLEQGSRLSTSAQSGSSSSGIWAGFSDFFQRIVVQPTRNEEERGGMLQELPLLQVCLRTTVPAPFDTDTAADDVLSQLLYAGLGNIGSTFDGLLSVMFPKMIKSEAETGKLISGTSKPEAELCAASARCVTAGDIGSLDAFYAWLEARLPGGAAQLELWGTAPGTKRVANLWRELLEGEISLEDSQPPKRTVHVASVRILNEAGKMLVEAYQEMADGRVRPRNRPLSEKMKPGESVEEACLRGILEELGDRVGARDKVALLQETYSRQEEQRESFSYPGLMTTYVLHTMSAHIKQLPLTDFDTEEDEDGNDATLVSVPASGSGSSSSTSTSCAVGVRRHYWKWV